ncbi:hypothetical protein wcw_0461 [Waddlia chondrophila WSU 86-1044]|uniref:Uncharacterized protein n=1 Tax=Waddlia chondrophila (strain ATCC VR-1470 / WSU 86-1044) TaxID=716544 RepID=D6YUM2_WADCW|nr:hypothetical protein wcw_0461 [Waddlia chondrophila WSU 86-1044]
MASLFRSLLAKLQREAVGKNLSKRKKSAQVAISG